VSETYLGWRGMSQITKTGPHPLSGGKLEILVPLRRGLRLGGWWKGAK